jgi:hypothetical protein
MKTQKPRIVPKYVTYGFFSIGLFSAIAFRAIIVLQHIEPNWVRPVWYFGVVGYIFFFFYRFEITKKRKKAISDYGLLEKIENKTLSDEDRKVLTYLLSSIKVSLEDKNYALIFFLSIVAITADIILSTMK